MAKYKNIDTRKNTVIRQISNSLDRHGRIKGKSKKQTKILKAGCSHHKVTEKGKVKSVVSVDPSGECKCNICKHRFTAIPYSKEEQKQIKNAEIAFLDQDIFILQQYGADESDIRQVSQAKVMLTDIHKKYDKVIKIAKRLDKSDNRKNKKGKDYSSSNLGGWGR